MPAMVHAYQDRFRALLATTAAVRHLCSGGSGCTVAGNGNGVIDGTWDAGADTESVRLWQHLRLAGIATGSTDTADAGFRAPHSGGWLGVQRGGSVLGLPGSLVVCSDNVPAGKIDIALDDGDPAAGSLRAGTPGDTGLVASPRPTGCSKRTRTRCIRI